jgi:hypothetical protein
VQRTYLEGVELRHRDEQGGVGARDEGAPVGIKAAVDKAREGGRKRLPPRSKEEFLRKYEACIGQAKKLYGTLQRSGRAKRRGRAESPIRAAGRKLA